MSQELHFVETSKAPAAVGPYSQAVVCNGLVFVSGQIPLVPGSNQMVGEEFPAQVAQVLSNMDEVLKAAGVDRSRVLKVNVYLTDMGRFGELNELYSAFFGDHRPARAAVQVSALPRGAQVEMEAVAAL